ncbi:MAG: lasso peptide biosynthesis protein [Candidatus Lindowbacteria bacterium]|nr:lasso peptide biosynthesis protein [Candidatus Lindowbacteria bacterium]
MTMFLKLKIFMWTIVSPFELRKGPIDSFKSLIQNSAATSSGLSVDELVRTADSILLFRVFGKQLFRTRCLKRAFVIFKLLKSQGYQPIAHIGFSKASSTPQSHVWISVDDQRISDPHWVPQRVFHEMVAISDEVTHVQG